MPDARRLGWPPSPRRHVAATGFNAARARTIDNGTLVLAAAINSTVVAGENPTVGSTVWLPAESVAPGR
jgi:hypothetical protein